MPWPADVVDGNTVYAADVNAAYGALKAWGGDVNAGGHKLLNVSNVLVNKSSSTSRFAVVGLSSYANNAAAVAGGLTAGDGYLVTGTNPSQLAIVT